MVMHYSSRRTHHRNLSVDLCRESSRASGGFAHLPQTATWLASQVLRPPREVRGDLTSLLKQQCPSRGI